MKILYVVTITLALNTSLFAKEKATISPDGVWVGGEPIVCPDGIIRGGKVCTISPWGEWVGGTTAVVCPDGDIVKGGTECIVAPDGSWVGVE